MHFASLKRKMKPFTHRTTTTATSHIKWFCLLYTLKIFKNAASFIKVKKKLNFSLKRSKDNIKSAHAIRSLTCAQLTLLALWLFVICAHNTQGVGKNLQKLKPLYWKTVCDVTQVSTAQWKRVLYHIQIQQFYLKCKDEKMFNGNVKKSCFLCILSSIRKILSG